MLPILKTNIEFGKQTILFFMDAATEFRQILVTSPFKSCSKCSKKMRQDLKKIVCITLTL